MGQCLCREDNEAELAGNGEPASTDYSEASSPLQPIIAVDREKSFPSHVIPASEAAQLRRMLPHIDNLVLQTLAVIGNLVEK
jgi:hypothetical protein